MSQIIDAHTHVGRHFAHSQTSTDLIMRLDSAGVNRAVVIPMCEGEFNNEEVHRAHVDFPDRLIPFCLVNPYDGEKAIAEIRRCVEERGFKGIKLHPTLHGYPLDDHALVDPIFRLADDLGVLVTSHGAGDLLNHPAQFAEMAGTFPTVPLLMVHMGYFWLTGRAIEASRSHANLYLDCSRVPIWEVCNAVSALGAEKVVWGTDAPFVDYEWEFKKMRRSTPSIEGYGLVVGGNIARLLNL